MTKADQIRALYAQGHSVKHIAGVIGCRQEYVRVCARQRSDGPSKADTKWLRKNHDAYLERMRVRSRRRRAEIQSTA